MASIIHEAKKIFNSLAVRNFRKDIKDEINFSTGIYLLKVNNENAITRYEICLKLTKTTSERRQWCSGVFIINFKHISHLVLVFLLLTFNWV